MRNDGRANGAVKATQAQYDALACHVRYAFDVDGKAIEWEDAYHHARLMLAAMHLDYAHLHETYCEGRRAYTCDDTVATTLPGVGIVSSPCPACMELREFRAANGFEPEVA